MIQRSNSVLYRNPVKPRAAFSWNLLTHHHHKSTTRKRIPVSTSIFPIRQPSYAPQR